MSIPSKPLAYTRLSDLRLDDLDETGRSSGLANHEGQIYERAAALRWPRPKMLIENDLIERPGKMMGVSAFKRRRVVLDSGDVVWRVIRPVFTEIVRLLKSGRHDGLIGTDIDRLVRDPRDLEDMIDLARRHGVVFADVSGSLDLATDNGITMARVMVAMANKSSLDTARRVTAARAWMAHNGVWGGGPRMFGFEPDGVTKRSEESIIIETAARRFLQGESLRGLTLELRDAGVQSVGGGQITGRMLRDILLRPRNAGLMIYRGKVVGSAPWERIYSEQTHSALVRKLSDPNRRTTPGPAPRWLGSNLYDCDYGTGDTIRVGKSRQGNPVYRCTIGHFSRLALPLDDFVHRLVIKRLMRKDVIDLFIDQEPEEHIDFNALEDERLTIRQRLNTMAEDHQNDLIDREQFLAATAVHRARSTEIANLLNQTSVPSPIMPLVYAANVEEAWHALPLSTKRLVVNKVVRITLRKTRSGRRPFDPKTVEIEWLEPSGRSSPWPRPRPGA